MDIIAQIQALLVLVAQIQSENVDLAAALESAKVAAFAEGKTAGFEEGKIAGYALGFEDGKNSVPVVPGGFTQEQVDAMIAEAVDPLKKSLAEKDAEIVALKESIPVEVSTQVQIAIAALKADLAAKFAEAQASESSLEGAFADLLK